MTNVQPIFFGTIMIIWLISTTIKININITISINIIVSINIVSINIIISINNIIYIIIYWLTIINELWKKWKPNKCTKEH